MTFEVYATDGGFRWRVINAIGVPVWWPDTTTYPTDVEASKVASQMRTKFYENAKRFERFPGNF